MGRNYWKKEKWNEEDMITAIQTVKVALIAAYRAAKHSQIPRVHYEIM